MSAPRALAWIGLSLLANVACLSDVVLGETAPLVSAAHDAGSPDAAPADASAPEDAAASPDAAAEDASSPDAEPFEPARSPVTLSFYGPPMVDCVDGLAGREADFEALTPDACGFTEGAAELLKETTRSWALSGDAVAASFGLSSVRLQAGVYPDQPPELLVGTLALSGFGPLDTARRSGVVGLDRKTETAAGLDGFVGVELARPTDTGSCFLTFGMRASR